VTLYCQDESRFGMFTHVGKGLTAKGIKPVCPFQQVFRYTYLFGAYSPVDGDHFELIMPNCSTECFQLFLQHFAERRSDQLNILQVDNAAFHKAKRLEIPDNVVLLFQPPYSPELNPAEKIWWKIKRATTNLSFPNLEELHTFLCQQVNALDKEIVKSICDFQYYQKAEHLWLIPIS
jgi:transposase